jgi:hypothetical protein
MVLFNNWSPDNDPNKKGSLIWTTDVFLRIIVASRISGTIDPYWTSIMHFSIWKKWVLYKNSAWKLDKKNWSRQFSFRWMGIDQGWRILLLFF